MFLVSQMDKENTDEKCSHEDEFERDEYIKTLSGEDKCKAKFWKCTGKVVKGSMHYADEPGGVWG